MVRITLAPIHISGCVGTPSHWRRITAISLAIVALSPAALAAQETDAQLAAAVESYRTGNFDAAVDALEPLLGADDLDPAVDQRARELAAQLLHARGEDRFRNARIAEAIADFDRQIQLQPQQEPEHWQRGIAYYYAGEFDKGRRQFELHRTVNPQDVENAAWHFLCVTKAPKGSTAEARKHLIPVARDARLPMAQIQKMFAGDMTPDDVLRHAATSSESAKFYADLYVGLYYEALNRSDESLRLMERAAASPASKDNYMGDVARVHVRLRKQMPPNQSAAPKVKQ